jgi:alcohol/geraniol dehydrogenase (NADP+)
MQVQAMAAKAAKGSFSKINYDLGVIGDDQVDIAVTHCGICHSDLSMLNNDWGMTQFPFVPGHEVAGRIVAMGRDVKGRSIGQRVGLGWYSASCGMCQCCSRGDQNLCGTSEGTIVSRHGGFATHVRCQAQWATPLPEKLDLERAGPLFCGGITVFNPIVQFGVKPTDRVGVVGIGGLGHLAVQFLNKWGCEVTAFTSSASKAAEAKQLGAHETLISTSDADLAKVKGKFDFLLVTVNVPLNWPAYVEALAPRGRLHVVGAVLEPIAVGAFPLILGQKSLSGSPLGSPATTATMLEFCARHDIRCMTEEFALSDVNSAFERLHSGKARYRIVLRNDLA